MSNASLNQLGLDSYQTNTKMDNNAWITDPRVPDPENGPEPLGWCMLVRPYPIKKTNKTSLIITTDEKEFSRYVTNIGRVVKIGPCCWTRPEHKINGQQKNWVEVGDFISFPNNVGAKRKFKGVSYLILMDDEIVERLPDPQVFDNSFFELDIPEEDMIKYNTIKNPNFKG